MTSTTLDFLGSSSDVIGACPFVLDQEQAAAGHGPVVFMPGASETAAAADKFEGIRPSSFVSYPSNVLSHDMNRQDFECI